MARKKSTASSKDVREKMLEPFAQRLSKLIDDNKNSKELQVHLGVSQQAISQYRNGFTRPSLENICKIAIFYHVSVDYLLGLTDVLEANYDAQKVQEYTGLSEKAISKLHEWVVNYDSPGYIDVLSLLVEDRCIDEIMESICAYISFEAANPTSKMKFGTIEDIYSSRVYQSLSNIMLNEAFERIVETFKEKNTYPYRKRKGIDETITQNVNEAKTQKPLTLDELVRALYGLD